MDQYLKFRFFTSICKMVSKFCKTINHLTTCVFNFEQVGLALIMGNMSSSTFSRKTIGQSRLIIRVTALIILLLVFRNIFRFDNLH